MSDMTLKPIFEVSDALDVDLAVSIMLLRTETEEQRRNYVQALMETLKQKYRDDYAALKFITESTEPALKRALGLQPEEVPVHLEASTRRKAKGTVSQIPYRVKAWRTTPTHIEEGSESDTRANFTYTKMQETDKRRSGKVLKP